MNIGAKSSQTPLCHSTLYLAKLPNIVLPQRTVWLTGRMTQVPRIAGTNYYFICETTAVTHRSSFVPADVESVVSFEPVSAAMWPIRLLCNDGLQCSQYSGLGKSNYGHCVCAAWLPCSSYHLSTVNYLFSSVIKMRPRESRKMKKKDWRNKSDVMIYCIIICKTIHWSFFTLKTCMILSSAKHQKKIFREMFGWFCGNQWVSVTDILPNIFCRRKADKHDSE